MQVPVRRRISSLAAISVVAVAITVISPGRAYAQNAAAESLFNDGQRLMKDGKVAEACDAFMESNKLEPRAGTLINLGMCREKNGQLASAWSAYKDAGTRATDVKKQQLASERATALEPRLSYLMINVPDESRVDGLALTRNGTPVDAGLWNRALPVDGGTYVIAGHAPGHEAWSTTVVVPIEKARISVEVPRFKDLKQLAAITTATPTKTVATPAPDSEAQNDDEQEPAQAPSMFTTQRKVAIGVAGLGVAALVGGIVMGQQAKGFQNDAHALCPDAATPCTDGDRANELMDKAHSRALLANISFGVSAASLIGAGVLWFLGAPATHEGAVAVTPHAGVGTASIDMTVRF